MNDQPPYRLPRTVVPERYRVELVPDLPAASYTGQVVVSARVAEATATVVCNAVDLDVRRIVARGSEGDPQEATVGLDAGLQRVTATFPRPLGVGPVEITYDFAGELNDRLHGFYRSTYTGEDGTVRTIATTQFEPTDARRAFPCWDEPDLKATFEVSLVVADGLTAIANSAVVSEEPTGPGLRRVRFAETMVMSTYLVAFIVGEFDFTAPVDVGGVPVRVAAPPGRAHLTSFAVEAARHSLEFLAGYFDLPYPADKLDHVAIPDFAAGAMENLGCVTYRESALLVDRDQASQLELQRVATVVAHETAHMWFGDLVTMKWWNGIWLNEAFATFMELTTTNDMRPDWDVWAGFGAGKAAAMALDGLRSTRPVEYPVGDPVEAEAMFDLLTYQKGGSVLRMLEQHLGAEVFRSGIAGYLSRHRYGNTETSDLWDALEEASGQPVRTTMESWIFQGGHPVVDVSETGTGLVLTQRRFTYDGTAGDERWVIPVSLRWSVGGDVRTDRFLLDGPSTTIDTGGPVDWVVLNEGGSGFYRVNYSPELLARLARPGLRLQPLERIGLLNDTWASVLAGRADLADWATLVAALGDEDDPDVWSAALSPLRLLDATADDDGRPALEAFVRRVVGPAFARIGWDAAEGEADRLSTTRARLVSALGTSGADPAVRAEAARRLEADRSGGAALAPDLRTAVTHVVAAGGGTTGWEDLRQRYLGASNPQEQERNLYALPSTGDPDLLLRTLDFAISPDVRSQNGAFVVALTLSNAGAGAAEWQWVEQHWDSLLAHFTGSLSLLTRLVEGVTGLVEPAVAERVRTFLTTATVPIAPKRLEQILERLDVNVAFAGRHRSSLPSTLGA